MKCPHCLVGIHESFSRVVIGNYLPKGRWSYDHMECSECHELILQLVLHPYLPGPPPHFSKNGIVLPVYPLGAARHPPPPQVDDAELKSDYREACAVVNISPKAAAALGRRCLQHILREKAKVKHDNLDREIQQVLDAGHLPSHLADAIDSVRTIGNFAAHPIKITSSGEIVDVEPGEAEWTLDTVEGLMDFYWVKPALLKAKRDALNAKLQDAGKPKLK